MYSLHLHRRGLSSTGSAQTLIERLKSAMREGVRATYEKMLVPQLREKCEERGLDKKGKKSLLVDRLMEDL